jgi:hypothetical protein
MPAVVRLRVRSGARSELHTVPTGDVLLGRRPGCDLAIDHPSVAEEHARLLIRRGRLILVDLGTAPKGTRVGGRRLQAPIAMRDGAAFRLGDVHLNAWVEEQLSPWIGARVLDFRVEREIEAGERGVKRYLARAEDGRRSELVIAPGREPLLESSAEGIRLVAVVRAVARKLRLPLEAWVAIVAQLAEAAGAFHRRGEVHGAIGPWLVQLGFDGSVNLLGASQRSRGQDAEADRLAVERLTRVLLGPEGRRRADWPAPFDPILTHLMAPASELVEVAGLLRGVAHAEKLDPSTAHVARVVRLLAPDLERPLARVAATSAAASSSMDNAGPCDSLG